MKNKINILYTCDNAYLSLTSISIASVIYNNPDSYITFYIATENEDSDNYRKLVDFYTKNKNIKFKYLDCKKYDSLLEEKKLDKWGSNSYYVYWKLFAYDLIDEDNIWYLDSDAICLNRIENPNIDKSIGCALDSAHACFNRYANIPEDYYLFNTGSLFVNIKEWKKNKCVNKVINYISTMQNKPLLCDQDILAISLQEDIEVISTKYNYLIGYDYYGVNNIFEMYSLDKKPYYKQEEIIEAKKNIIFYHCLGGVFGRPWEENNNSPIKEEFEKYIAISAWPNYSTKRNQSLLFKVEKTLEFLPKGIYNKIHNFAMRKYVERLASK